MGAKRKKSKNKFKKFLIWYVRILALLMVLAIIYVIHSLIVYENLQVYNYLSATMEKVADSGARGKLSNYVDVSGLTLSKYEGSNTNVDKAISDLLKSSELKFKLNPEITDLINPVYDVYVNDNVVFNVKLNGEKKLTKLAILTIQDWKLDSIKLATDKGVYDCRIEIPNDYTAYVNDIKVEEESQTESNVNAELAKYSDVPYVVTYKISNLIKEPNVRIEDENGKESDYKKENNTFSVGLNSEAIQDENEAMKRIKGNIDVMQVAKDWSLYLTNDLGGTLHGFYKINKYLIKDSYMWNYAYKWATDVDITFISSHKLNNPAFTNTKVSNFKIYSENAFSCDVYLEKNMTLTRTGDKLTDKMNERMYFAYYKGEWKLVSMQSITKNT